MSEAVEKPEQSLWWVGVILVLIGAIGQNLGNNIVSVAHAQTQEENSEGSSIKSTNTQTAPCVLKW